MDIRAIEVVRLEGDVDDVEGDDVGTPLEERLWVFQCKREKRFGPKRVKETIDESLPPSAPIPHGFVLAVSADVSKKARDVFREEMVVRGVNEFLFWAKGELEDMLFQPRNDRLLFAYFGISLQPRRRSMAITLRARIAKKKQLEALLVGEEFGDGRVILLRDATDERYPTAPAKGEQPPKWLACRAISARNPGHLVVLLHEHFAATTPNRSGWDAIFDHDEAQADVVYDLRNADAWSVTESDVPEETARDFWKEYISESDRCLYAITARVPIDRILAIDPTGDGYYPVPHIFIDFDIIHGPFEAERRCHLSSESRFGYPIDLDLSEETRVAIFPRPLPNKLHPPPVGFDDTSENVLPMSEEADEKLKTLFANITESGAPPPSTSEEQKDENADFQASLIVFREWRETVALPLFSEVVARLRAAGHEGRVVVRTDEFVGREGDEEESVELRVGIDVGRYAASYRARGILGISLSQYTGWTMNSDPPLSKSDNSMYSFSTIPGVDGMTKEQLEEHVLTLLKRLLE